MPQLCRLRRIAKQIDNRHLLVITVTRNIAFPIHNVVEKDKLLHIVVRQFRYNVFRRQFQTNFRRYAPAVNNPFICLAYVFQI